MSNFILILLAVISTTFSYTNGPCSYRSGICIDSGSCSYYGGTVYSGQCPSDPNSIKCCDNIPCSQMMEEMENVYFLVNAME